MLLSFISLLFSLIIVLATSLEPPTPLSSPSLSSTTRAFVHSTLHSRSEPIEHQVLKSTGEGKQEKRFEKRLRKRCFYIGTFFKRIDCDAPANSTRVPYAPAQTQEVESTAATSAVVAEKRGGV